MGNETYHDPTAMDEQSWIGVHDVLALTSRVGDATIAPAKEIIRLEMEGRNYGDGSKIQT
jgi:hypothetical protein